MSTSSASPIAAALGIPQAVPPSWKDFGKPVNDLLSKDLPLTFMGLEIKTRTPSNVTFKVAGKRDTKSAIINADLEGKYVDAKNGVTFTQGWTTANKLTTQVELENNIAKGLKLDITSDRTISGSNAINAGAVYKQPGLHTRAYMNPFKGPLFAVDTMVSRDGILVGGSLNYSVQTAAIERWDAAVGYSAPDYAVTLHALDKLATYAASYYHKVNRDVEAGAKATYNTRTPNSTVHLEVGAKTYLDNAAYVKAKIDNAGFLTMGYTQALRPGVRASFALQLNTQQLGDNTVGTAAHKVGSSFVFES